MIHHFVVTFAILLVAAEYLRLIYIFHGRLNIHSVAVVAIPGYVAFWLVSRDAPLLLAYLLAIAATMVVVFALDRVLAWLAPPENRVAPMVGTLASIGFLMILTNGTVAVWGSLPFILHKDPSVSGAAPVLLPLLALILFYAALRLRTGAGLSERAAADDRFLLMSYGFPVQRVLSVISLLGGAGIGICGLLLARYIGVGPFIAYDYIFPAIGIAYVAGSSGANVTLLASVFVSLALVLASIALSDDWVRVLAFASLGLAVVTANRLRSASST